MGPASELLFYLFLHHLAAADGAADGAYAKAFISAWTTINAMFLEYIQVAMDKATYEIIDDPEPYYDEVTELKGLWATGKTLEECRRNLQSALEEWIAAHLAWGIPLPPIGSHTIEVSKEPMAVAD